MAKTLKVGIVAETKNPPDKRVAVAPKEAVELQKKFPHVELVIQKSDYRSYKDSEFSDLGLTLVEDVRDCDILIGVKEVKIPYLIENKKYLFFSHTAKKQSYNRELLKALIDKKIQMIDHEYLTDKNNIRQVAFGRWAGIVGAYNALLGYTLRENATPIKRAIECHDMVEMLKEVKKVSLPKNYKILITGGGRVAYGAIETLAPLNLKKVNSNDFLTKTFDEPVYCQIEPNDYTKRIDGSDFDLNHFFKNPKMYESTFNRYTKIADMYIACHFWDDNSPKFITKEEYQAQDFQISIIADVSCDIADPIASTLRPSTIANPFYGYNKITGAECNAFDKNHVTVMAIDNLPGELPRDASTDFGKGLMEKVFPSLFGEDSEGIIARASITKDGKLTEKYSYLQNFLEGKE